MPWAVMLRPFRPVRWQTYTLMVGAEPTTIKKPAARCPECGGELECLGVGEYAILKLRLRAAHAQAIDTS